MSPEKKQALELAISAAKKQFGSDSIMKLTETPKFDPNSVIPTRSISLNSALGIGGWPRGRIIEIWGGESSGKTTLCLEAIAETQKSGGTGMFIDMEHALDIQYAEALGVNIPELLISQPDYAEQALGLLDTFIRSGCIDLIIVDSVAALIPQKELEGEVGDQVIGLQARLMSQALRKIVGITHKTNTSVIFTNQTRNKIGVMMGSPITTSGGNALKFYASIRAKIARTGSSKDKQEAIGNTTKVEIIKNKCVEENQPLFVYPGVFKTPKELLKDDKLLSFDGISYSWSNYILNETFSSECYEITSKNGRQAVVNKDHPFLTENGFIRLEQLKLEDKIYLTKTFPTIKSSCTIPPRLLAMLLADGDLSGKASLTIVDNREDLQKTIDEEIKVFSNLETNLLKEENNLKTISITNKNGGHKGKPNKLKKLLKEEKIFGLSCKDKFIPSSVFGETKEYKSEFLLRYILHDGYFEFNENKELTRINFYTSSQKLKEGITNLLLSLGIYSSSQIKKPRNGGVINGRQIISKEISFNIRIDSIYELNKFINLPFNNKESLSFVENLKLRKKTTNRKSKSELSDKANNPYYKNKIKSIINIGEKTVYSIHVPGNETFDCGGFITHNCAPPFKTAEFEITFGKGVDQDSELIELAIADGIIKKSGPGWLKLITESEDISIGQGKANAIAYLNDNPEIKEKIRREILENRGL